MCISLLLVGLITQKVPVFVTKSQLGPQLQSYLNWVLFLNFFSNLVLSVRSSLTTLSVCCSCDRNVPD